MYTKKNSCNYLPVEPSLILPGSGYPHLLFGNDKNSSQELSLTISFFKTNKTIYIYVLISYN